MSNNRKTCQKNYNIVNNLTKKRVILVYTIIMLFLNQLIELL